MFIAHIVGVYIAKGPKCQTPTQERWIYMPCGKVVRQDERTSEKATLSASSKVDSQSLAAMTAEDGCFQPGALPNVQAASAQGSQKLLAALTEEKGSVVKARRVSKERDEKEVKPLSPMEPEAQHYLLVFYCSVSALSHTNNLCWDCVSFSQKRKMNPAHMKATFVLMG